MNSFCFFMLLHATETPNETFSCFCTRQKCQMKLFHASAHDRKTKWNFLVLLHTTERPKRRISCFCTLQKGKKEVFHASAHCRKAKKNFFMLLHTAERPKIIFSCFCTLQKGQKEFFHASAHCRKAKKKIFTLGESHFPNGLAFPRLAKVVSQKVWHFRAWRKSFPEWFGISALGESHSVITYLRL